MRKDGDSWKDEKREEGEIRGRGEKKKKREKKLLGVAGLVGGTGGKWQWWWCTRWPPLLCHSTRSNQHTLKTLCFESSC